MSEGRRRAVLYASAIVVAAGLLFAGYGITTPPDANTRLNGAAMLANLGSLDEALAECDQVLEEHPESVEARIYRAAFLSMGGRHDEALAAYDDALAHVGDDGELRRSLLLDRAGVLLDAGRTDACLSQLETLREQGAELQVLILEGEIAFRAGRAEEAVAALRQACALQPEDTSLRGRFWRALMRRGEEALAAREFDAAVRAFEEAIPLFERAGEACLKAAEARYALEDPEGALALLRRAGPQTPGVAPLVFRGATALLERGRRDEAFEALEGAFVVDPAGVRLLLEADPAWKGQLDHEFVRELLETDQGKDGADLTAPE